MKLRYIFTAIGYIALFATIFALLVFCHSQSLQLERWRQYHQDAHAANCYEQLREIGDVWAQTRQCNATLANCTDDLYRTAKRSQDALDELRTCAGYLHQTLESCK